MRFHQFVLLTFATVCAVFVSCEKKEEPTPAASAPTNSSPSSTNVAAAVIKPAFAKLPGKWQRTDGDYLLEIKGVESSGKLDAHYFNPKPINVSQAAALEKDGGTKVFVELRDVNYPGSTYTLAYDPKSDQLFGQYFQAALQQTFDVTFERVKE